MTSVDEYLERLRGGYGDEIEIRYMKEIYNTDITIWVQDDELGASTDAAYPVIGGTIHIAYRNGVHYDAVIPLSAGDGATMSRDQDAGNSAMADTGDVEERTHDIETGKKAKGTLRIIFWNSNGWEQERCEKIAEVALEEEADAMCAGCKDASRKERTHERIRRTAREGHREKMERKGCEQTRENQGLQRWRQHPLHLPQLFRCKEY